MKLDRDDEQVIAAYIRTTRPDYKGPVFIDLRGLEKLHMASSAACMAIALVVARYESKEGRS